MTNTSEPPSESSFNRPQRIAFAILLSLLFAFLLVQHLRRPVPLDEGAMAQDPLTLPARLDPNTASLPELTRIPHLAQSLAQSIVEYRDARLASASDHVVFRQPSDLLHVPGLKQKTVDLLLPYLEFPEDPESATQP